MNGVGTQDEARALDRWRALPQAADGLVREVRTRSPLARCHRPLPHLGQRGHAPADARRCRPRALPGLSRSVSPPSSPWPLREEPEVLAAWSGLGYYRRARMLHRAAQFITQRAWRRAALQLRRAPHPSRHRRIHLCRHRQHRLWREHRRRRRQRGARSPARHRPPRGRNRQRPRLRPEGRPQSLVPRRQGGRSGATRPAITTRP